MADDPTDEEMKNTLADAIRDAEEAGTKKIEITINLDDFRKKSLASAVSICSPAVTDD